MFYVDWCGACKMTKPQFKAFMDNNNNGVWEEGESFTDNNNNGIRDEYRPTTLPDNIHIMGTDNQGRDVLSRVIYGFNISITFALIVVVLSYLIGMVSGDLIRNILPSLGSSQCFQ